MTESMHQNVSTEAMAGPAELAAGLWGSGFVRLNARHFGIDSDSAEFARFRDQWNHLAPDDAMADGGSYRLRRYSRLRATPDEDGYRLSLLPHAAFQQDTVGNWRAGARVFAPIPEETLLGPLLRRLVVTDLQVVSGPQPMPWTVGVHLVRIVASEHEPGRPTPEGRHRDGHRFVGMHLLRRDNCIGGQSTICRADGVRSRLTLQQPLDSLIVDDTAVWHEVSPISPLPGAATGLRDMLLVDLNP